VGLGIYGYNTVSADNQDQTQQIEHQDHRLRDQSESLAALAGGLKEANRRLAQVGVPQVPLPTAAATKVPQVIFQQPSVADMNAAVARFCGTHAGCKGRGATVAQVKTAVRAYCSTGACVGPAGADGTSTQGTPPSDAQIAQAVSAYCGTGACTGRGIASLACGAHSPHGLQIRVTYTDGTTDTITCT
jgi:hypothetical protein